MKHLEDDPKVPREEGKVYVAERGAEYTMPCLRLSVSGLAECRPPNCKLAYIPRPKKRQTGSCGAYPVGKITDTPRRLDGSHPAVGRPVRHMEPADAKITALLARVSVLRGLAADELEDLARLVRRVRFVRGESIFRQGDPSDILLIVISGQVRVLSSAEDGNEVLLNIIDPGDVVGEIGALDGRLRTADCVAAHDTEALVLERDALLPFIRERPGAAQALIEVLCRRIRQTTTFVEDAVLSDLPKRILHRLEALAEQYGRPSGKGVVIDHTLTQQEIADFVGVSRMSVSKVLTDWRRADLIEYGRGVLRIMDMARLRESALAGRE